MPSTFVIMPFSAEFDDVYEHIIRAPLTTEGFDVLRADEMQNSRNVMHDVVQGILQADLVVADLTGGNANVFYELGIAHAAGKNVVMLAQDVSDVPFDLRAYRVITYSTHFAKVAETISQIVDLGRAAKTDGCHFGNPVTDYVRPAKTAISHSNPPEEATPFHLPDDSEPSSPLEIAADLQEGMATVSSILQEIQYRMLSLEPILNDISDQMSGPLKHDAVALKGRVRAFATHLDEMSIWMRTANRSYGTGINLMTSALDATFATDLATQSESMQHMPAVVHVMEGIETNATEARAAMSDLAYALDNLPRVEKEFNRAKRLFSEEIHSLVANTDQTIAVVSRTKNAASQLLSAHTAT